MIQRYPSKFFFAVMTTHSYLFLKKAFSSKLSKIKITSRIIVTRRCTGQRTAWLSAVSDIAQLDLNIAKTLYSIVITERFIKVCTY